MIPGDRRLGGAPAASPRAWAPAPRTIAATASGSGSRRCSARTAPARTPRHRGSRMQLRRAPSPSRRAAARTTSPASTCHVTRGSRSRFRTFCDLAYVHAHGSPSRTTYQSGIRCGQPSRPTVARITVRCSSRKAASSASVMRIWSRRLTPRATRREVRGGLAHAPRGRPRAPARRRRRPPSRPRARARRRRRSSARRSPRRPSSSSTTVRSSRAQRARSGEIHRRARREAGTSPVRGQPSTSAAGSTSGRGSKRSSVTVAALMRSRRKWRTASFAGS